LKTPQVKTALLCKSVPHYLPQNDHFWTGHLVILKSWEVRLVAGVQLLLACMRTLKVWKILKTREDKR